jgi:imidazolonepropionase-like amidohydrolase
VACGSTAAPTSTQSTATSLATDRAPQDIPADALVISNGMVIAADGSDPIPDGVVVIKQDRILAVGHSTDFVLPQGVRVIDARDGTIMPGIVNAHVHGVASPLIRRNDFLLQGVTSVCDLGSALQQMPDFKQDFISTAPAARGFRAGPIITAIGGYPGVLWGSRLNYEVKNPDEARAAVVDLAARGADVIKIALEPGSAQNSWPTLDMAEVKAVVEEAHTRGLLVRAHLQKTALLDLVLDTGVDVIEHVPGPSISQREVLRLLADSSHFTVTLAYETELARIVSHNVILVPTLDASTTWCESSTLTDRQRHVCYDFFLEPVRQFHSLGGVLALGTDYNSAVPATQGGMPLREMKLLLAAGLAPLEVIEAGTRNAAYVCGHGDDLGTLQAGKLADVIVVNGNPLDNIEAMKNIIVVIINGQVVYEAK